MVELRDKETDRILGTISDAEFRFLVDELEEESPMDRDYYFDANTIDMLENDGAPSSLIQLLRKVLGSQEGMEIKWARS